MMRSIVPSELSANEVYQWMIGAITPRPIAFVSTLSNEGIANLAPFSYFNALSSKPAMVAFSVSRKDSATQPFKDTLVNAHATGEVVINVVTYNMVRQMAVASIAYPPEVNEFEKSGFTPIPSDLVRPHRVKESPIQMEGKVRQIIELGKEAGAGNLILVELVKIHVEEAILDQKGRIDPKALDIMGRLGRAYYVRVNSDSIHTIYQASHEMGIGFDQLPQSAKKSKILTGNDLGQLAGITTIPAPKEIAEVRQHALVQAVLNADEPLEQLHFYAQQLLAEERTALAAQVIWLADTL
ncbi:MAG: flavin reductase family protein [Saprospiraceae bacterium]|nr:flavin reductase family protein [Saprospiraceae bacterium]